MTAKQCPGTDCDSEEFFQDDNGQWRCKRCNLAVQLVEPRKARRPASMRRRKAGKTTKTKKVAKTLVKYQPSKPLSSVIIYCNRCHQQLIKLSDYSNTEIRRFRNRWKGHECKSKSKKEFYT
ncbi:MAG: hypothetical protein ACXAEU_09880 [Candidatus Hodarchaeales archaeon]